MSNKIQVVRYIRPSKAFWDAIYPNNLHGITIVFDVDYDLNSVKASWSVCNGDNFEKSVGKRTAIVNGIAASSSSHITFPVSNIEAHGSLTNALVYELEYILNAPRASEFEWQQYEYFHNLFLEASRKLRK